MEPTRISHYEVGRLLGRGGMGEVYEAVDLDLERPVALKFVAPELASDPESLRRFEREARSAAALNHPHIATLYAFDRTTDRPFIAMELLSGESLRDRVARGPLPLEHALAIARDVAAGLALAHRRGIAHRDIKPENLMFDRDGAIKIADFGLARATQASRLTMTGSTLGTAAYMAPESVRASQALSGTADEGPSGAPADVFALGVTLHEMLTGGLPFHGESPLALLYVIANQAPRGTREVRPEVPEAVDALIDRMLRKEPAERPDAPAVARELAQLTGAPPPVLPEPTVGGERAATMASGVPTLPLPRTSGSGAALPRTGSSGASLPRTEDLEVERVGAATPVPVGTQSLEAQQRARPPRGRAPLIAAALAVLAALGWLGYGVWTGPAHTDQARALSDQGYDALQRGDTVAARERFIAALGRDPNYPKAAINLALVMPAERSDSAVTLLKRVIGRAQRDSESMGQAFSALADLDARSASWQSAAENYGNACAFDPSRKEYPGNQAFALVQSGQPADARRVLDAAIERWPDVAGLYKNMALAWYTSGEMDSSLAWLDRATVKNDRLPSVWSLRARTLARLGDRSAAGASLARFIELGGDSVEAAVLRKEIAGARP